MTRPPAPASALAVTLTLALAAIATVSACKKHIPMASQKDQPTGYATVEELGRGVFVAVNTKTLFRVRDLFPTQALYARYFTCPDKPISGMGRYHADGLYGVMRHKTQHAKVVIKTIKVDQPMTPKKGETIGSCGFREDVPHKLLTITYSYQTPASPAPAPSKSMAATPVGDKLLPKMGSWTFVTAKLAGRWYLFIILAMDGKPIDEIGQPVPPPTKP